MRGPAANRAGEVASAGTSGRAAVLIPTRRGGTQMKMRAPALLLFVVAGLAVLQSGGNAIDAAVAVGLTLGVVDGHNSGIGGGCFLLIRLGWLHLSFQR